MPDRLARALAAIDVANADDPHTLQVRGALRPKELAHAELATEWVRRLREEPSDALLLAARAHHVRRWEIPRESEAPGPSGYHRWRRALQDHHARIVGEVLEREGFDAQEVERVVALVRKRGLGRDPEAQALEDALCLIFLETQLAALVDQLDEAKLLDVMRKTLAKMSAVAIDHARKLPLAARERALLERAAAD